MASPLRSDPSTRIWPEPLNCLLPVMTTAEAIDHFDRLPDSLLILALNKIRDVISDDESSSIVGSLEKSLFRLVFDNIGKPLQALGKFFRPKRSTPATSSSLAVGGGDLDRSSDWWSYTLLAHSSVKELQRDSISTHRATNWGLMMGVLLKWRADFRSKLYNNVIPGAASMIYLGPHEQWKLWFLCLQWRR